MKKNLLFIALFFIFSANLFAQYVSPGTGVNWTMDGLVENSNGVVTLVDDVYFINNDLTVSAYDSIIIETQNTIKLKADVFVIIEGYMTAKNTKFTAEDTSANFKGFKFDEGAEGLLENCEISYGGGIKIYKSDVKIDLCEIFNSSKDNCTGAIEVSHCNAIISNCTIYNNQGPAIASSALAEAAPEILYNNITANNTLNTNMPQINLGTTLISDTIIIKGNTITGGETFLQVGGISVSTLAGGNVNALISENNISNNRYGIAQMGYNISTLIFDNIIDGNKIQNDPMLGGSGLNFYGDETNSSVVRNNVITNNLYGATLQGTAKPDFGTVEYSGNNTFSDNGFSSINYAIYNNTPNDISAVNNYWTTDCSLNLTIEDIENMVYHKNDDATLGLVDFDPFLNTTLGISENNNNNNLISVYPNPAKKQFTLSIEKNMISDNAKFLLLNLNGQLIISNEIKSKISSFDISELNSGIYLVKVYTKNSVSVKKLIVE